MSSLINSIDIFNVADSDGYIKFYEYNSTTGKLEFSDTVGTYTFS